MFSQPDLSGLTVSGLKFPVEVVAKDVSVDTHINIATPITLYSGNAADLYLGGACFESGPGHRLS